VRHGFKIKHDALVRIDNNQPPAGVRSIQQRTRCGIELQQRVAVDIEKLPHVLRERERGRGGGEERQRWAQGDGGGARTLGKEV